MKDWTEKPLPLNNPSNSKHKRIRQFAIGHTLTLVNDHDRKKKKNLLCVNNVSVDHSRKTSASTSCNHEESQLKPNAYLIAVDY